MDPAAIRAAQREREALSHHATPPPPYTFSSQETSPLLPKYTSQAACSPSPSYHTTSTISSFPQFTASSSSEHQYHRTIYAFTTRQILKIKPKKNTFKLRNFLRIALLLLVGMVIGIGGAYFLFDEFFTPPPPIPTVSVAIIGAGPAGLSTSQTLSLLSQNPQVKTRFKLNITVFDAKDHVGGRLTPISKPERERDWNNVVRNPWLLGMSDFAGGDLGKCLLVGKGVEKREVIDVMGMNMSISMREGWAAEAGVDVGVFDGEKMLSVTTRPYSLTPWLRYLRLLYTYGPSLWRSQKLSSPSNNLHKTLLSLSSKPPISSLFPLISLAGINPAISKSASETLSEASISSKYIAEVLSPKIKRQFGGMEIEGLSGLGLNVAIEREEQGVYSGWRRLMAGFWIDRGVRFEGDTVVTGIKKERIEEEGPEKWILELSSVGKDKGNGMGTGKQEGAGKRYETFDKVIIAAPWNISSLRAFEPGRSEVEVEEISYNSIYLTFFTTPHQLSPSHFGANSPLPKQILPLSRISDLHDILDITHLRDVPRYNELARRYGWERLYRIISTMPVLESSLNVLFVEGGKEGAEVVMDKDGSASGITSFHQDFIKDAYPLPISYSSLQSARRERHQKFEIAEGIWTTNIVERIASTVDLAWWSGNNVARLVLQALQETDSRSSKNQERGKGE